MSPWFQIRKGLIKKKLFSLTIGPIHHQLAIQVKNGLTNKSKKKQKKQNEKQPLTSRDNCTRCTWSKSCGRSSCRPRASPSRTPSARTRSTPRPGAASTCAAPGTPAAPRPAPTCPWASPAPPPPRPAGSPRSASPPPPSRYRTPEMGDCYLKRKSITNCYYLIT